MIANIGLAAQNTYAGLLILRMLQSTGSSGTVALANALVSDLVTSAQRGSYISYVSMTAMVGPSFGPVIGGLLDEYLRWRHFCTHSRCPTRNLPQGCGEWLCSSAIVEHFIAQLLALEETKESGRGTTYR